MPKKKCVNCWENVDVTAVICTNCGTNQQTCKSIKKHKSCKKKSFSKILKILFLIAVITASGFYLFTSKSANSSFKEDASVESKIPPKETITFPINITEAENADKYRIYMGGSMSSLGKNRTKNKIRLGLNVRVDPPKNTKDQLRLKVYSGKSSNGEYDLIYDYVAKAKLQKRRNYPSATFSALFYYTNKNFEISPGQNNLFFRSVLYDSKGRVIKEGKPTRWVVPRSTFRKPGVYDSSIVHGYSSKPPSLDGNTIYPYFNGSDRTLKFAFMEKNAFKITSFSIDGIKYPPVFIGSADRESTYKDRKTKNQKTYYSSSMSLKYPFGGQVKLRFKYKTSSGKFKKETFSFYLLPPAPLIKAIANAKGDMITISWNNIAKGLDKSHFFTVPTLELQKNNRRFKSFPVYQQNSYKDKNVFRGEPIRYRMSLKGGIYKASLWSSEKGIKTYKLSCAELLNPFLNRGINVTVPSLSEKAHPIRIELLSSSLCYENTGITSCKLLKTVINRVSKEQDMVFYDRAARDYIIDEKYFALSPSLKKQFIIKESDYAIQIKDYSRQDGNGLELWMFKKSIEGTAASKKTTYWRIADIRLDSDEKGMLNAAERLITKIRDTLEFRSCADNREKNIKPVNVICPPFRPINQQFVVWNYEAVCESLFLTLGEKSDTIKILSRDDWDQHFSERISRFDKGHSFINNAVREVLLTGRLWRKNKKKTYYIQACDAFSGEVIACKIFSGKVRDVASELAQWVSGFKLSNDIKVDFQISKFHQKIAETMNFRPWSPRKDLLKNYGPSISNPQKSWSVRRKKKRPSARKYQKAAKKSSKGSFYAFVERQWKDGYRTKAIKLLEDDWKKSKDIKTGELLSSYYSITKRPQDVLVLYDAMLLMDGCPKSIYENYNLVKRSAQGEKPKSIVKRKKQKMTIKNNGILTGTDAMDYGASHTFYIDKKKSRKIPRTETSNSSLEKYYFIDRDNIYPEWAPNQPCRTAKLVFSIPKKLL